MKQFIDYNSSWHLSGPTKPNPQINVVYDRPPSFNREFQANYILQPQTNRYILKEPLTGHSYDSRGQMVQVGFCPPLPMNTQSPSNVNPLNIRIENNVNNYLTPISSGQS